MGICGDSSIIAKVACIIIIVSFVACTIAIFTPYWNKLESSGTISYSGLFYSCQNDITNCFSMSNLLDTYKGTSYYDDFIANLTLQLVGWVLILVSMVILIVYACCTFKVLGIVGAITCLVGGSSIIAGLIVYGVSFDSIYNQILSWSFGLDVAGAALALVSGVLLIINTCLLP